MEWISLGISALGVVASLGGAALAVSSMLGKYREKDDQLEDRNKEDRRDIKQLMTSVAVLDERMQNIQKSIDSLVKPAQSHSPIQLTDKGWDMVKKSGTYKIFEDNRDRCLAEFEAQKPRSQYDTQEKAYKIMGDKFNAKEFDPIKQWALLRNRCSL